MGARYAFEGRKGSDTEGVIGMPAEIAAKNVVILANNFNPSIVTERWLISRRILAEEEFDGQGFYTPPVAVVKTQLFDMQVMDERIQVTPRAGHGNVAIERLQKLIETLPETPYIAVGMNFHWRIRSQEVAAAELSRTLFVRDGGAFARLAGQGASFGGSAFIPYPPDGRLKIDIFPANAADPQSPADLLVAGFNYHFQIDPEHDRRDRAVIGLLRMWGSLEQHSNEFAHGLVDDDEIQH